MVRLLNQKVEIQVRRSLSYVLVVFSYGILFPLWKQKKELHLFNFLFQLFLQKQEAAKRQQRRQEQTEALKNGDGDGAGEKVADVKQSGKSAEQIVKADVPKIGNEEPEKAASKSKKKNNKSKRNNKA